MKHLIDETSRRRKIQSEFNLKNNIKPKTVKKTNNIITSMLVDKDERDLQKVNVKLFDKNIDELDKIEVMDHLESLKRKMKKYAQNFQFEQAALLRDEIIKINGKMTK